ncbi:ABC transporter permease [Paractinoplanes atraurantiacus]|uniref:ABC-2 type transport system permease protein n=1 Tax=Paractinoplanes atraurantiacus TaxID=1036182 RepID=A0A285HH40_9ACTN|nr:ABC transporter permease [Actinoplanes atraurantiacus]SNY35008.1 ABC-2 type transport system permease protein [Actinoplanes atraurantiacus]
MRAAISSEWTKLWTTRTIWWALLAAFTLMAAAAGQNSFYVNNGDVPATSAGDVAVLSVAIAQLAFVALAMLVMTSEYSAGTIRATLSWVPSRGRLLSAKIAVVAAVTLAGGVLAGLLGGVVAAGIVDDASDITGGAVKIGIYLMLLGVLATGLAAALRGPVVTLVVLLMGIVVVPPLLQIPDISVLNGIADTFPGVAGDHFLSGDSNPYPQAVGLLILMGWAVLAVVAGWRVLQRRDA